MVSTKLSIMLYHLVAFITFFEYSYSLPQGAPKSACFNMLPFHGGGIMPLTSDPLFDVLPDSNVIGQDQPLRMIIQSQIPDLTFKGFMIQARSRDGRIVGKFLQSSNEKLRAIDCEGPEDTGTHTDTTLKKNFVFEWQAPSNYIGEVIFNATIAQDYDKFWVGKNLFSVNVDRDSQPLSPKISTTREPLRPNFTFNSKKPNSVANVDNIYDECGVTKSCFGVPSGCVDQKNCKAFSAVITKGDRYIFEMRSSTGAAYIALGLSNDEKMGDDSVVECINESGSVRTYASWTTVQSGKFDAQRSGVPQGIIRLLEGRLENGMIYCQVERDAVSTVKNVNFDLMKNSYYLLLASGSGLRANTVDYHDILREASQAPLKLSIISNVASKSKLLLRLHGAFMLVAWIGTTSLGVFLARYFKQTWKDSSLCGKDIWFAWHRILMVTTWTLTMAAFVIIWVELKGWSTADNPHAILGTIVTVICFFQAVIATFRPHPGSRRRPLFNWVHWFGGNSAHILAIITIFTAAKLLKAELPTNLVDIIMIVYVAVHVILHLVLSVLNCLSDRKENQKSSVFPLGDMGDSRTPISGSNQRDAAYSTHRKVSLCLYAFIVIVITVCLTLIIVLAPIKVPDSLK